MSVDASKLLLYSGYDAFKNSKSYTGSIDFPTSLTAGQTVNVTSAITLSSSPEFMQFWSFFKEFIDALNGVGSAEWYSGQVGGYFSIGIHISAPAVHVGWMTCGVYPKVDGTTLTVTGTVINPYSDSITLDALNVPFLFVDYTTAN